jgi:Transposase DDE domain group 1
MIRARSSLIWRSVWRWAGTVWPTWPCCAPNRASTVGWRRTRPSRAIAALASDAPAALKAIDTARAAAREQAWRLAGEHAPDHGSDAKHPLVIDLDATLVTSHSDKEHAAPTFKRGYGFHPLTAFVDHGAEGTGEPLAILVRPGNAGSNTATDHITVVKAALAQLPGHRPGHRLGRKVLVRAGGTKQLTEWLTSQRLSYSVGFILPANTPDLLAKIPENVWTPAYDAHDQVRDGAWVAELTGLMDLDACPTGPPGPRLPSTPSTDSTSYGPPADPATRRPDQPHHPDPWNPAPRDDNG